MTWSRHRYREYRRLTYVGLWGALWRTAQDGLARLRSGR